MKQRNKPEVTVLPSGLRVVSVPMPGMASVSLGIWVGVGGRHEPETRQGAAHFIEHMVFKGTPSRSALQLSAAIEGLGGYLNAFTEEEYTCIYARASADRLPDLADVLFDMILRSSFSAREIKKERQVIKEELSMYLDQPQQLIEEITQQLLWPDQPLGRPLTGTPKSLDGLGRRELTSFMGEYYVASNTVLAAAGHVNHADLLKLGRALEKQLPHRKAPTFSAALPRNGHGDTRFIRKKTEQTHIAVGMLGCSRNDPRRHSVRVMNTLLGENMSSRLFQVLREEHGLAYSVESTTAFHADTGGVLITAGVETKRWREAFRLLMRELKSMAAKPPGAIELRKAVDYAIGHQQLHLEATENRMMWAGEQLLGYGLIRPPADLEAAMRKVTPQSVREAAKEMFRPGNLVLAVVGPDGNERLLKQELQQTLTA